jgi:heat shock protein HslJ
MDSMLMEGVDMKRLQPALAAVVAAVLVLLVVAAAGCGGTSQADDSKALEGKTWRAVQIVGLANVMTAKGSASTISFSAGKAGGSGAVNRWGATYTTGPGNTIQISALMTTEMAGPPENMAQEAAYYAALPKAATYQVTETSLTLLDDKGGVLVKYEVVPPAPLTGTEWQMTSYDNGTGGDQTVSSDSPVITATFGTDGTLAGNATINRYSTRYTITADGGMTIDPQIITTKMAGPDDLMAQEAAFLAALPKTATHVIDGDQLTLRDASGALIAQFTAK